MLQRVSHIEPLIFGLLILIDSLAVGEIAKSLITPFKFMGVRAHTPGEVAWSDNSAYSVGISEALGDLAIATSSSSPHATNTRVAKVERTSPLS